MAALVEYSGVSIDPTNQRYVMPLRNSIDRICTRFTSSVEVVLLGSIATGKYIEPLLAYFGERLMFPEDFIGRGDMSRGGLLLRAVATNTELQYRSVIGATNLTGSRPAKLAPLPHRSFVNREPRL
jgi:hypothetical protein